MSSFIASVQTAFTGYIKYRGIGHYTYLMHRLTGLGTLLFLTIHIVDTSFAYFSPELYQHAIEIYRLPLFMVGEMGLVFAVIYHGINGLRVAYVDLFKPTEWNIERQNRAAIIVLVLSVLMWIPAAIVMFGHLLENL
jgi:succinate dehydrogenase / fumarate reductase cytochrome b subunit